MDESNFMERALELARRAEGNVSPRPPVGSIIVSTDGEVVGEGRSRDGAGLHAEIGALESAGDRALDATCVVTLEPCVKWCAPALIDARVRRVVAATSDPNPKVDGKGFAMLREAGIEVEIGMLEDEARELIEPFAKWIRTGRPFVTLKLAASLDGKVAASDGTSQWITGEEARAEVHELRRRVDAVMVGSGTVLIDDPKLTYRGPVAEAKQPLRVVIGQKARIPRSAEIFRDDAPTLVLENGIDDAMEVLGERGICHVLLEGGPTLASSFVERGLVDRFILYLAPKIIGGDAPGLFSNGVKTLTDAWNVRIENVRRVGDDVCIEGVRA